MYYRASDEVYDMGLTTLVCFRLPFSILQSLNQLLKMASMFKFLPTFYEQFQCQFPLTYTINWPITIYGNIHNDLSFKVSNSKNHMWSLGQNPDS